VITQTAAYRIVSNQQLLQLGEFTKRGKLGVDPVDATTSYR
jgi:hypothetical protein